MNHINVPVPEAVSVVPPPTQKLNTPLMVGVRITGQSTVTEYICDTTQPAVSVALRVKLKVLALVGVPLRAMPVPVVLLSIRPLGSEPPVTDHVTVPLAPVTAKLCEYAVPIVPLGRLAGQLDFASVQQSSYAPKSDKLPCGRSVPV